ncbi:MAG: Glutamyl-tRNA reductase [Turneriella sp.]|nr:Glutamyl-tRNA reductase [Turneriella sp.]
MPPLGFFKRFHALSLSIATHEVEALAAFPDSRRFYTENSITLPPTIRGLLYMATCNRIEIYTEFSEGIEPKDGFATLYNLSPIFKKMEEAKPRYLSGEKVLVHLISVASGLKSLALGETQIAGQIKRDMSQASALGWLSSGLSTLLAKALEAQKKIRTQTGISENAYSLMSLVEEAICERNLHPIQSTLVLVGASDMSAKVTRFALRRGVKNFTLVRKEVSRAMNREMRRLIDYTPNCFRIVSLADFQQDSSNLSAQAIILASSATEPLFSAHDLANLTRNKTLVENSAVVDLSLPANVAPDAAEKLGNRFISLASLKKISDEARAQRAASAKEAEPIIRRTVYQLWLDSLYRENPSVVRDYLETKTNQTDSQWQRLAEEASLNEKQKRILYDFVKKEQRRTLQQHREMILDLISNAKITPEI